MAGGGNGFNNLRSTGQGYTANNRSWLGPASTNPVAGQYWMPQPGQYQTQTPVGGTAGGGYLGPPVSNPSPATGFGGTGYQGDRSVGSDWWNKMIQSPAFLSKFGTLMGAGLGQHDLTLNPYTVPILQQGAAQLWNGNNGFNYDVMNRAVPQNIASALSNPQANNPNYQSVFSGAGANQNQVPGLNYNNTFVRPR